MYIAEIAYLDAKFVSIKIHVKNANQDTFHLQMKHDACWIVQLDIIMLDLDVMNVQLDVIVVHHNLIVRIVRMDIICILVLVERLVLQAHFLIQATSVLLVAKPAKAAQGLQQPVLIAKMV